MHGWCGKIWVIDLERESWDEIRPEPEVYHAYIGGRGLAGYFLKDHVTRSWDDPMMPSFFYRAAGEYKISHIGAHDGDEQVAADGNRG